MDFGTLLSVAQKNSANKQSGPYYPTKFTPPKKESKQSKTLSDNIKRFLARKEDEERQKALEEKQKRDNLLALRDHKAQSRINKHLKVCKAANKSVLADAINNDDTALTMAGPSQPDEDDYGYVSQEASAFYNQLMNKYSKIPPEKPLFSDSGKRVVKDIASTKDRVKQALKQQEIEESLPHRRKRKATEITGKEIEREKNSYENEKNVEKDKNTEKDEKPKIKKKLPTAPPMDFVSLLKLAEKKQYEPVMIEVKPKPKAEESERPMTKKQKKEYQKEKEWKEKKERERNGEVPKASNNSMSELSKSTKTVVNKIPKLNNSKSTVNAVADKSLSKSNSASVKKVPERPAEKSTIKSSTRDEILEERRKLEAEKRELESMRRMIEEEKKKLALQSRSKKPEETRPSNVNSSKIVKGNGKIDKQIVNSKDVKSRQFPPADTKPRQFPPPDVKPKQFPPSDMKSRTSKHSINRNGRPIMPNRRRIYDDDDDEYDSELDDFIDDDPQEGEENYSKYISEIFGYDRSKYKNCDDDDINMESNFAQQLKEEYVSTKIGIMEDLEDIRQEALEKKRKALMMKKLKKK